MLLTLIYVARLSKCGKFIWARLETVIKIRYGGSFTSTSSISSIRKQFSLLIEASAETRE